MDDPRDFLLDEDGMYPGLADLPSWWDRIPPDPRARDLPHYDERQVKLSSGSNRALSKRRARSVLQAQSRTFPERDQPLLGTLRDRCYAAAAGAGREMERRRGQPGESERIGAYQRGHR